MASMFFLTSILFWILYAASYLKQCVSFRRATNELWVVVTRYDRQLRPHSNIRSISQLYRINSKALLDSRRQGEVGSSTRVKRERNTEGIYNSNTDEGDDDTTSPLSGKGISVDDWLLSSQRVKANTKLTIIPTTTTSHSTVSAEVGFIQVEQGDLSMNHYIIPLPSSVATATTTTEKQKKMNQQHNYYNYYMIDVPPFSPKLVQEIRLFLKKQTHQHQQIQEEEEEEEEKEAEDYFSGETNTTNIQNKRRGRGSISSNRNQQRQQQRAPPTRKRHQPTLKAILITCKTSIHYREAPGTVYAMRKSELPLWKQAFPDVQIIMHRNDVEKDLQDGLITQVLDGYGPWAWNDTTESFEETGHKMVILNWDKDKIMRLYSSSSDGINATELALREAGIDPNQIIDIRANEANRSIVAVYTPGHTMGSMCYVMPSLELCLSGHTIPPEEQCRDNVRFDGLGTISTNKAGLLRQVDSALHFVETYVDRFHTIFPSRGKVMYLPKDDQEQRRSYLKHVIKQFGKVAKAYSDLGIL